MTDHRPFKKPRLDGVIDTTDIRTKRSAFLSSLSRQVSPPIAEAKTIRKPVLSHKDERSVAVNTTRRENDTIEYPKRIHSCTSTPSPFRLTRPRGLPLKDTVDTVTLHDILGDPLIKQAWIFNFCFDINWTMKHFDADVRSAVDVKVVHGSWKKEDGNRIRIKEDQQSWKNVQEIQAYMPDAFGTHHSKMIILFKHDDTAQVIIHTANMLEKDWDHMTQAVWLSPVLQLLTGSADDSQKSQELGSSFRFKQDLLRYVKAYGNKLKVLAEQLKLYNFSKIRAALIASVPSHQKISDVSDQAWGHVALKNALSYAYQSKSGNGWQPNTLHLVSQVSSIATLPASWLDETIYKAAKPPSSTTALGSNAQALTAAIIFPIATDLQNAITGYATGGSIHTKIQSAQQQKQVTLLRPQLHRWGAQSSNIFTQAGRNLIPPHIKTYICYSSKPTATSPTPDIEWALLTSANLSTQAWGAAQKVPKGVKDPNQAEVHIQSFEIGVLVWPELFTDETEAADEGQPTNMKARMVPTFGKDTPDTLQTSSNTAERQVLIGLRMPYDLPLTPYKSNEMPWSPAETYTEPDRLGQTWT